MQVSRVVNGVVEIKGVVKAVAKQLIPKMYVTVVEDNDGNIVEFDTHSDLVLYREGEQLSILVSQDKPDYQEGEDFLGRGTIVSIKREGDKYRMLVSIGGLLFMFTLNSEPPFQPTEKVYIKITRA